MASPLGSPVTNKFAIGTAELRLGTLAQANKLTFANSVGLIDQATLEVTQTSVDLLGGFPKVIADTAIVSQESSITATLREYARRNFNLLVGEGIAAPVADVNSLVVSNASAAGVDVDVTPGDGSLFTVGDLVQIYTDGENSDLTLARIESIATDAITLDSDTPLLFDVAGTSATVYIYKIEEVAIGAIMQTKYFSVQLVQTERSTGRPLTFNFWKGAIGAGMTYATNADDFASTELSIKLLQPSALEYASGADLEHLAAIIPTNPTGLIATGGDYIA